MFTVDVLQEDSALKKFIIVLTSLMFIIISLCSYSEYRNDKYNSLLSATNAYKYNFEIPQNIYEDPENLQFLKKAADDNNINFLRIVSYYDDEKGETYTNNFLYLSTETNLFKKIPVSKGRFLTADSMETENFLSTQNTKDKNQIGQIEDFGGGHNYFVYPIDELVEQQTFSGKYKAECENKSDFQNFMDSYVEYVRNDSNIESGSYIKEVVDNTYTQNVKGNNTIFVFTFCMALLLLTFIFYLVSQTKAISVMKLHGYVINQIRNKIFLLLYIKCVFIVHIIMCLLALLFVHDMSIDFIVQMTLCNGIVFLISYVILDIVCAFYIKYTKVTYCIKGKKPLNVIIAFNLCFKIALSIIIIVIGGSLVENLENLFLKQDSLKNWKVASEYGVFYPVKSGDDIDDIRAGNDPLQLPTYEIYMKFFEPEMKAIYANSIEYSIESIEDTSGDSGYIRNFYVNTNYLDAFPVYDENGKQIKIDDTEEESVFLVPEQYKNNESMIREISSEFRKSFLELHTELYGLPNKPNATKIKIIYTQNNQEIFSFNTEVFPEKNNTITDPIIMVMTQENTLGPDVSYLSRSNARLFVPLKEMDAKQTYDFMLEQLQKYSLDDNFPYFVRLDDYILQNISEVEEEMVMLETMLGIVAVLFFISLAQFIYLLFQKDKLEMFLKKSLGFSFFEKYSNIYGVLLLTNSLEFVVCFGLSVEKLLWIFLFKILIEMVVTSLLVVYFERKNIMQVLKEGV